MIGAAQWLGACVLLLSIALLCVRRFDTALLVCVSQSLLAAAALGARGWEAAGVALLAFGLTGAAIPLALRHLMGRSHVPPVITSRDSVAPWIHGTLLLAVAVLVLGQLRPAVPGEALVLGASVVLLGLLMTARRPHPLAPSFGVLASQNGMLLVASAIPGLPLPVLVIVALPVLPALLVADRWLRP
jgi:hypothetical protein